MKLQARLVNNLVFLFAQGQLQAQGPQIPRRMEERGAQPSAYQVLHTQTPLVSGCWELHTEAPPLCLRLGYFLPFSALSRRSCRQPGECLRSPSGGLCRGEASQGQGLGMGGTGGGVWLGEQLLGGGEGGEH